MSAELAARRTAEAAVLVDYQSEAAAADVYDRAMWGARLADMLTLILAALDAEGQPGQRAAVRLEQMAVAGREALDDELADRQTALEQLVLEVEQLSEELENR